MERLQRLLDHQVSIAALIEFALWLVTPYVSIGLVWAFLHAGQVQQMQTRLERVLPAGAEVAAIGVTAVFWPAPAQLADVCPAP